MNLSAQLHHDEPSDVAKFAAIWQPKPVLFEHIGGLKPCNAAAESSSRKRTPVLWTATCFDSLAAEKANAAPLRGAALGSPNRSVSRCYVRDPDRARFAFRFFRGLLPAARLIVPSLETASTARSPNAAKHVGMKIP